MLVLTSIHVEPNIILHTGKKKTAELYESEAIASFLKQHILVAHRTQSFVVKMIILCPPHCSTLAAHRLAHII
jgi:hypothetical protein